MYHADKYEEHNKSLERFVIEFNFVKNKINGNLSMHIQKLENYNDDGYIEDISSRNKLFFDWEKRHSYYLSYGFPFESFGQFERKIIKKDILFSIQCSKDESAFCFAWHKDFFIEAKRNIGSITANGNYEYNPKRFTKRFLEFKYEDIQKFYSMLEKEIIKFYP